MLLYIVVEIVYDMIIWTMYIMSDCCDSVYIYLIETFKCHSFMIEYISHSFGETCQCDASNQGASLICP